MKTTLRAAGALLATAALATPAAAAELELIPMLGLGHVIVGADADDSESGASIAVSFGGRLGRIFSLHGQLSGMTFEVGESDATVAAAHIAALFHAVDNGTLDLMVGPVFGAAMLGVEGNFFGEAAEVTVTGPSVGVQAGAYVTLTDSLSLGPSIHYSHMFASEGCFEVGSTERCSEIDDDDDDFDIHLLLVQLGLKVVF